jgi:hypothetical protein
VHGWLIADYMVLPGMARFLSHSVVETGDGELIDVTLTPKDDGHLFIRHPGTDAEFLDLVEDDRTPWIDCLLSDSQEKTSADGIGMSALQVACLTLGLFAICALIAALTRRAARI